MTGTSSIAVADEYFSQGEHFTNCGKLQDAEENFTSCIELLITMSDSKYKKEDQWQQKLALAYNNRGHIYYRQVEFTKAIDDYTEALNYDPTLVPALYNRGTIHYRLNRFQEAENDMRRALQIDPDFQNASIALQKCLHGHIINS